MNNASDRDGKPIWSPLVASERIMGVGHSKRGGDVGRRHSWSAQVRLALPFDLVLPIKFPCHDIQSFHKFRTYQILTMRATEWIEVPIHWNIREGHLESLSYWYKEDPNKVEIEIEIEACKSAQDGDSWNWIPYLPIRRLRASYFYLKCTTPSLKPKPLVDVMQQNAPVSLFNSFGGSFRCVLHEFGSNHKCRSENYLQQKGTSAIIGLHSSWISDFILACARPSDRIIKDHHLLHQVLLIQLSLEQSEIPCSARGLIWEGNKQNVKVRGHAISSIGLTELEQL